MSSDFFSFQILYSSFEIYSGELPRASRSVGRMSISWTLHAEKMSFWENRIRSFSMIRIFADIFHEYFFSIFDRWEEEESASHTTSFSCLQNECCKFTQICDFFKFFQVFITHLVVTWAEIFSHFRYYIWVSKYMKESFRELQEASAGWALVRHVKVKKIWLRKME